MKTISKAEAARMKAEGFVFKPHNLYQDEKTAVLVEISPKNKRAFQISKQN
jgi:hypothetical protein